MAELFHTFAARVRGPTGTTYEARAYGAQRKDGTWSGWLQFHPVGHDGPELRTDQETSQPDHKAVEYWASGLEPIYLDGALQRALEISSGSSPEATSYQHR